VYHVFFFDPQERSRLKYPPVAKTLSRSGRGSI
jgi:hypothetical protein